MKCCRQGNQLDENVLCSFCVAFSQVVIDAFRLINANMMVLGHEPRQTTSNLGHLNKPSIQVIHSPQPISDCGRIIDPKSILSRHCDKNVNEWVMTSSIFFESLKISLEWIPHFANIVLFRFLLCLRLFFSIPVKTQGQWPGLGKCLLTVVFCSLE